MDFLLSYSCAHVWTRGVIRRSNADSLCVSPDCHTKSTDSIVRHVISGEEAVDGVRVTSFKRTVLDCLIGLDFRRGLAIADSALRLGLSRWDLIAYIKAKSDVLGWEKALDAPAWANPLAANGGSLLREPS